MSEFSDEMAQVALEEITEYGESCVFTRKTKGNYSTTNLSHASSTGATYTAYCLPYEFDTKEIDNVTVQMTDRKLLVPVTDTSSNSIEPLVGDLVTIGATQYRVKAILNPVRLNGENVLFIVHIGV